MSCICLVYLTTGKDLASLYEKWHLRPPPSRRSSSVPVACVDLLSLLSVRKKGPFLKVVWERRFFSPLPPSSASVVFFVRKVNSLLILFHSLLSFFCMHFLFSVYFSLLISLLGSRERHLISIFPFFYTFCPSLFHTLLSTIFKTPSCLIHGQFRASPVLVATTVTALSLFTVLFSSWSLTKIGSSYFFSIQQKLKKE